MGASVEQRPWPDGQTSSQRAQVSEATIRREAKTDRLKATKVGGRRTWRFRPEWIDEWLEGGQALANLRAHSR